ncbi:sigma-54-dependent Fis family transcriptional regulator [Taibaiella lutea]|uniref:Sigma-54-dependent Fis family transcriptional regulator n=1 Tax=Taibaiella lutea TaxID=2608001 RepID=A0A5M6CC66_9BACT|nr:sigma-54 dependent transcriptional regulator [Taibaiella lutea]KAA5532727.1 sigma-54-dependent Fis family transcriptional regulator [Taibaiella lutea]
MHPILVVDDDHTFAKILESFLSRKGYIIDVCYNIKEAVAVLDSKLYALHLLDYRLPDGTGLDILNAAHNKGIKTPSIIMTSFNDVRTAVKAMHSGAFDYITKPVNQDELLMLIEQAIEKEDVVTPDVSVNAPPHFVEGESAESKRLHEQIRLIAPTDMSVIINGESGTGKEYVARLIHTLSDRSDKTFIAVDCGTLSTELAASELFGHMKGAFTGALQNKTGKFEDANGGTLFLDEIGNLSYEVQVKLLRALQERVITPVGGNKEIKFDIRVIVATNEDLNNRISEGKFREDLYHRLNEFKVVVPPLRKRGNDIILFIDYFIRESNAILKRNVRQLSPEVLDIFRKYDWPGNIRELKNIVKRLVLLAKGDMAVKEDLPEEMLLDMEQSQPKEGTDLKVLQENKERELILQTLKETKHNKSKTAKLLNIDRSTLYAKMQKYNIE